MNAKENEERYEALRLLARWLSARSPSAASILPEHDYIHDLRTLGLVDSTGDSPSESGIELIDTALSFLREEKKTRESAFWMDETLGLRLLGACYEEDDANHDPDGGEVSQMLEDGFLERNSTARLVPSKKGWKQIEKALITKPRAQKQSMTRPDPPKISF